MKRQEALRIAEKKVEQQNVENTFKQKIKYIIGEFFETDDFFVFDNRYERIIPHEASYGGCPGYKISKLDGEICDINWSEYSDLKKKSESDSIRFLREFFDMEGIDNVRTRIIKGLASHDERCEKIEINFNMYDAIILINTQTIVIECVVLELVKNSEEYTFNRFFDEVSLIEINEEKCFSQPSMWGRRLLVSDIVRGMYFDNQYYAQTHNLSKVEIDAVYRYCEKRKCLSEPKINYCDGCLMRDSKTQEANEIEVHLPFFINESDTGYFDAKGNMFDEEIGLPLWALAKYLNSHN